MVTVYVVESGSSRSGLGRVDPTGSPLLDQESVKLDPLVNKGDLLQVN